MERKLKSMEPQVDPSSMTTEAKLTLHKIFGQVVMSITPKATVTRLIRNAANGVPLTPEWKAFRDGALELAEKSSPKIES